MSIFTRTLNIRMENFDWTRFTCKVPVRSTIPVLYDAWTKSGEIEKWFLSKAAHTDDQGNELSKDQQAREGDSYLWNWYLYPDTEHGKFTAANGTDHLQFTFAGDCLVDITFTEKAGHVIVTLTQKNIPTDDQSKRNIRLGCHTGWSFYLVNLKSVYEGGLDLRNKDEAVGIMLNN